MTKEILEANGGKISLSSEAGYGSEVTIMLPFQRGAAVKRIVVVDDDRTVSGGRARRPVGRGLRGRLPRRSAGRARRARSATSRTS